MNLSAASERVFTYGVVRELIRWIENNLDRRITVDDCAEKTGYSKWYLQRYFHAVTGKTLAAFCREKRLVASARMLLEDNVTIEYVAVRYGFSSHDTFHKTFVRYYGMTPGEFRQKRRAKC
jgi:AraC-like DNA-binding protein